MELTYNQSVIFIQLYLYVTFKLVWELNKLTRTDRQREKYFLELQHQLNTSVKPKVIKENKNTRTWGGPPGQESLTWHNRTRWTSYNQKNSDKRTGE